jgi:hypothetical protein
VLLLQNFWLLCSHVDDQFGFLAVPCGVVKIDKGNTSAVHEIHAFVVQD